jgi:hypothetical protein
MDQQLQNLLQRDINLLKQVEFLVFQNVLDFILSYQSPFPKFNYGSWANL